MATDRNTSRRASGLPTGYRKILGIEFDGSVWYDTGLYLHGSDTIRFSFAASVACNVLGCYTNGSAQTNFSLYVGTSSSSKYLRYNGGTYNSSIDADTRYDVVITPTGSDGMKVDSSWTAKSFTTPSTLLIGTTSTGATSAKLTGTLYGDIIIDGTENILACERQSDGAIGYYLQNGGVFIENQGNGTPVSLGYDDDDDEGDEGTLLGVVVVDGTNVWETYRTFVSKGGFGQIVQWPALKAVRGNDWQEMDGYEPDLSDIHLDTRELDVRFVCLGGVADMRAFYQFLLSSPKMTYNFTDIGRTLSLRVLEMPSLMHAVTFNEVTVRFAADTPLEGYSYQSPSSSLPTKNDYVIDGTPLSSYGIRVLQGTVAGVIKGPAVKPLLARNISVLDGVVYDDGPSASVTVRARDITLRCFMTGVASDVWRNYDALLYNLSKNDTTVEDSTQAGARNIAIAALGATYGCFYKSQSVTEFTTDGRTVWLKFDLTLTLFSEEGSEGFF